MGQTLAIKGRGRVSREEIIEIQKEVSRKAMTVRRVRGGALIVANILVSLSVLLLLLYAVSVVFMPSGELSTMEMNLAPRQPTLDNFRQALIKIPLMRFVCNSFIMAGLITVGQTTSCPPVAFSLSFLEFGGRNVLFMLVMVTIMIPGETTIISNYLMMDQRNWLNSYQMLIVPCLTPAVGIFLFRQFYKSLPISSYESAKIDGCGNLRFIFCTLLPLTKSATRVMTVYIFISAWNMYVWPLLVTGSGEMRTMQVGISVLNSVDTQSITLITVGVVMIILPSIPIFTSGQKQLIWGTFSEAVKG